MAARKLTESTFEELVKLVPGHYQPSPSVIVQRFKFNLCAQQQGESVATFVSELRRLSEHCKFGETLEERLRDRIVCRIANNQLQRRLLKKVLELAQAQESANQGSQQLQQQQHSLTPVNKIDGHRRSPPHPRKVIPGKPCYHCRGSHSLSECRFKDAVCHSCNKTGHIAKACRRQKQRPSAPQQNRHQSKLTHQVERGDDGILEDPTNGSYELFNLQGTHSKPLTITAQVNHTELTQGQLYPLSVRRHTKHNGHPKCSQNSRHLM